MVATDGTTLKDGGRPNTKAPIPVELLIVTITTIYPSKRNLEDVKRLYKWVGLDTLSTAVYMLGGWPMLVSNFMPAVNFHHAVFLARHSRVVKYLRTGMSPEEIIMELLRMGFNLKGILCYILLRGRYEAPGNRKAYHYDSIVFVDGLALTIPRLNDLQDLGMPRTPETMSILRNIYTKSLLGG